MFSAGLRFGEHLDRGDVGLVKDVNRNMSFVSGCVRLGWAMTKKVNDVADKAGNEQCCREEAEAIKGESRKHIDWL